MKKFFKRLVASALSLVVCASMVTPAFAASFSDLQGVIDNKKSYEEDEVVKIEYNEGTVTLNEDVKYDAEKDADVKSITVSGENNDITLNLNGKTIDGDNQSESVIKVTDGAHLTVNGGVDEDGHVGTITGGTGSGRGVGGGVSIHDADFTMTGGQITGNTAEYGGGISVNDDSSLEMTDVTISDNTANLGGGLYVEGLYGPYSKDGTLTAEVTLNNTTVSGNTAENAAGGGLYAFRGDVTLNDSLVSDNTATNKYGYSSFGGGIYGSDSTITLTNTAVTGNDGGAWGGAIYTLAGTVNLDNASIKDNTATYGGGILAESKRNGAKYVGTTVNVNDSTFEGNGPFGDIYLWRNQGSVPTNPVHEVYYSGENQVITYANANLEKTEFIKTVTKAATCTEQGEQTITNKSSGAFVRTEIIGIDKLAHTPTDAVRENEKTATCAAEGSYDVVVKCAVCGEEISRETKTIGKLAHTPAEEAIRENEIPAKIGVAGSYDAVVKCSVCGEDISREAKTIDALPVPADPVVPVDPIGPGDIEIEDTDVPLAGLPFELAPEEKLTRAQLVAILYWLDGSPDGKLPTFTDVSADHLWALALGWAQSNGIIEAYEDGTFEPDNAATRGLLIAILNGYAKYIGSDITTELTGDADEILTWAQTEEIINDFFALLNA